MESPDDLQQLLERAKTGDREAFDRLFELYMVPVYRYIYLRTRDKMLSEDLTQTVFLKIYQSLPRYRDRGKSPLAFFFTVARNAIIDHQRKHYLVAEESEEIIMQQSVADDSPLRLLEQRDDNDTLERALRLLTEDQQDIIRLKFIHGFKTWEVADITGKSEDAIRQLQSRGLKALAKFLRNNHIISAKKP